MKKALILHGVNKSKEFAASHQTPVSTWFWLPWLQQQFNIAGVNCQNPLFPNSWFPDKNYKDDFDMFSQFKIDEDTIIVGWSCGGGFILKYLAENPTIKISHLILVAPWLDTQKLMKNYFEGFDLDSKLPDRIKQIDIFYSANDEFVAESVRQIIETYPKMKIHKFEDKGHFRSEDLGGIEFPELWEVCKQSI